MIIKKTQEEIINNWVSNNDETPIVTVICLTYNHEAYIEKAIEGFLMQETTFPFEVIIHDDASTDATPEIIREYSEKYPLIIKPIFESENQYSKQGGITLESSFYKTIGRYIALCEGDDYWVDSRKLQTQYYAMEENPQVDICATQAWVEQDNILIGISTPRPVKEIYGLDEVIKGEGGFVETATLFLRSDLYNSEFSFCKKYPIDYSLIILGSIRGGLLFIPEKTAVYRFMTKDSWTYSISQDNDKYYHWLSEMIEMLNLLDKEMNYQYHDVIQSKINEFTATQMIIKECFKEAFALMKQGYLKSCPNKIKAKVVLGSISPCFLAVVLKARHTIIRLLKKSNKWR